MSGVWIEEERPWQETALDNCPICGRLVTRRRWRFEDEGAEHEVCDPECESLYLDYWKARYGRLGGDADN